MQYIIFISVPWQNDSILISMLRRNTTLRLPVCGIYDDIYRHTIRRGSRKSSNICRPNELFLFLLFSLYCSNIITFLSFTAINLVCLQIKALASADENTICIRYFFRFSISASFQLAAERDNAGMSEMTILVIRDYRVILFAAILFLSDYSFRLRFITFSING